MNSLFIVLLLLSLLGLVIGLIKPATVKMQSRSKVGLVFGVAIIICFGLISATSKPSATTTAVAPAATTDTTTASTPVAQTTQSTAAPAPTPKKSAPAPVVPVVTPVAPTPPPVPTPAPTPAPAPQPTTLLSSSGTGTKSTQTFTTPSNSWQLSYTYDCSDYGGQGNFQVYIMTADGSMSFENTGVNELGASGSDTEYYHTGGSYYLEVNSECSWTVNVKG